MKLRASRRGTGLLIVGLAGLCGNAAGQEWVQQSPLPTNQDIYDLSFTTPTRGFVVGTWRSLVETRDGGLTWTKRMSGGLASDPFYRITFFDDDRGFIFGNNNDAWRTVDGGTTWSQMQTMLAGSWYYADFVSPTFGVAGCNGAGAYTADGGVTWNLLQPWPDSPFYAAIDMRDALVGLCSGDTTFTSGVSGVQRTTDGGKSWTLVREGPAGEVMWLDGTTALAFLYDGAQGTLVERSTDAGLTWHFWGSCAEDPLDKITRVDESTFVGVVHAVGTVYRSTDGGRNWTMVMPGQGIGGLPSMAPWSFSFPDPDHGYLGGPNGMLFASTDRGATWTQISHGIAETIEGLDMVNERVGFAVTQFHTLRTTNGGADWRIVHMPRETGLIWGRDEWASCIQAIDEDFAVVAGVGGIVFRTTDGGDNWESIGWPAGLHDIYSANDVFFTDRDHGWVVGTGDTYGLLPSVYQTTDGGLSWFEPAGLPRALYVAVDFTDSQHGWIATGGSHVFRTTDGGRTWTRSIIEADFLYITDMDFAPDGLTGFATGFYGDIYRTTDGGVNWTNVYRDDEYYERALGISVLSSQAAYYTVADNDDNTQYVRYTLDGGDTWTKSQFPAAWETAYLQPERIEVLPGGRTFVGGYWGIIAAATLPAPRSCMVDLNHDGVVDFADYLEFLNLFEASDPRADLTHDGVVDFGDYLEFLNRYDVGC